MKTPPPDLSGGKQLTPWEAQQLVQQLVLAERERIAWLACQYVMNLSAAIPDDLERHNCAYGIRSRILEGGL